MPVKTTSLADDVLPFLVAALNGRPPVKNSVHITRERRERLKRGSWRNNR